MLKPLDSLSTILIARLLITIIITDQDIPNIPNDSMIPNIFVLANDAVWNEKSGSYTIANYLETAETLDGFGEANVPLTP